MKICHISSDREIDLYGLEGSSIHIRQLTDAMVDAGHDVVILCPALDAPRGASLKARIHHLEPPGLDGAAWKLLREEPLVQAHHMERDPGSILFNGHLQSAGASILDRERPDFIYERYALFSWGGLQLSRRYDVPLLVEVNAPLCRQQEGYEKFTLTATAAGIETEIFRHADPLIAMSSWLKDWIFSLGVPREKVHVIPDAVNEALFGAELSGRTVRARYGLGDRPVIGHVGSYQWFHDIEGMFTAFRRAHQQDPECRLLLVGDGPELDTLKRAASRQGVANAAICTGLVPHESIPEHIAAMDVAVIPYRETDDFFFSPLKLFECMAAGTPTVAAALGQIVEVIDDGATGWLDPAGDNDALADRICRALGSPETARGVGTAGRKKILSQYTWQGASEKVLAIASSAGIRVTSTLISTFIARSRFVRSWPAWPAISASRCVISPPPCSIAGSSTARPPMVIRFPITSASMRCSAS
jgi:glycosyltransferase involved in cell wall biosynthesis